MSGREKDKNNSSVRSGAACLCCAEESVCDCVCGCQARRELSAVLCGMGVQCASAASSCSTAELQTRGESEAKRSDSWGEDEDRDCVRHSARQRRNQILIFCLLLQAVWSDGPVSI